MRTRRLVAKNFCQHRELTIDFPPGVNILGILGGNGRGKSNAIKAIRFAILGESGNAGGKADDLNWQAAEAKETGFVEWFFEQAGIEGSVKRHITTARANMAFGNTKHKSVSEVNAEMLKIAGVTKKTIEDVVFVMQGEIEKILFKRPAERAKEFQGLFGTESAEKIRELLQKEIATISTDPIDERIAELEKRISEEIDPDLRKFNDEKGEAETQLKLIDRTAAQSIKDAYELALKRAQEIQALQERATKLQRAIGGAQLPHFSDELQRLIDAMEANRVAADEAKQKLANVTAARQISTSRAAFEKELQEATFVLETPPPTVPAVTPEHVETAKKQAADAAAELANTKTFIKAFESGNSTCPTCGTDWPNAAEAVEAARATLQEQQENLVQVESLIGRASGELEKYRFAVQSLVEKQEDAATRAATLRSTLSRMGEAPQVQVDNLAALEAQVTEFDRLKKAIDERAPKVNALQAQVAASQGELKALTAQLAALESEQPQGLLRTHYEEALRQLSVAEQLTAAFAELGGKLGLLHELRARTLAELSTLQGQAKNLSERRKYKELCEQARAVLHRDCLPRMVTQAYLKVLNVAINDYLMLFNVPFTCQIKDDLDVVCFPVGAGERSAERLSGGQKVMLGIAFRFAVYSLFTRNLGFMVLDEPTNMLDDDHISSVLDILDSVRKYAHSTGMQLIVITHEKQLAGAFDYTVVV